MKVSPFLLFTHRSFDVSFLMATGANTTPLGRLHPILAAARRTSEEASTQPNAPLGSQAALNNNPELRAHLEAAKRAASALFSGKGYM